MYTPRVRTRDETKTGSPIMRQFTPNGQSSWAPEQYASAGVSGQTQSIFDCVTPNWREKAKKGGIVMNDMSMSRVKYSGGGSSSWSFAHLPEWGSVTYWGDLAYNTTKQGINLGTDINFDADKMAQIALAKAYEKINAAPMLAGEILSDIDKTAGMFRHPLKRASELMISMSKYRRIRLGKTTASAARATAEAWLEYRYGWKPVILDCKTAVRAVHEARTRAVGQLRERRVARGKEVAQEKRAVSYDVPIWWMWTSGTHALGTASVERSIEVNAGVIYDYDVVSSAYQQTYDTLGLRPRDTVATVWEVIPWSFVVDWFVNVGSWLNMVVPDPRVTVLGRWVTRIDKRLVKYAAGKFVYNWSYAGHPYSDTGSYPGREVETFSMSRDTQPQTTYHPVLTVKPLSSLQQLDGASLGIAKLIGNLSVWRH